MPPLVKKRLVKVKKNARDLHVVFGNDLRFKVIFENTKVSVVNLEKKICDCGHWQISGLLCKHAVCCIDAIRVDVEDFIILF